MMQRVLIAVVLWSFLAVGSGAVAASVPLEGCPAGEPAAAVVHTEVLRVATLNMAHGRMDRINQLLLSGRTIRQNLQQLAGLLDRAGADAIALQEADAPSVWSGDFDHVEYLLAHSDYRCHLHGVHAANRLYHFGTALISPHAFQGGFAHSFQPSPPTTGKGFVIGALAWNPGGQLPEALLVKVGSVHLDFSRRSVRRAQIEEVLRVLGKLDGPLVLMGDFNADWRAEGSSLRYLTEQLDLKIFQPEAEGLATYGEEGARLDWILVSRELYFQGYEVFPDVVSDHFAVVADIRLAATD